MEEIWRFRTLEPAFDPNSFIQVLESVPVQAVLAVALPGDGHDK